MIGYQNVKEATVEKAEKVKRNKKLVKENKILSSMFRSIDRETRMVSGLIIINIFSRFYN